MSQILKIYIFNWFINIITKSITKYRKHNNIYLEVTHTPSESTGLYQRGMLHEAQSLLSFITNLRSRVYCLVIEFRSEKFAQLFINFHQRVNR